MNTIEEALHWLRDCGPNFMFGVKSPEDAMRLYRYMMQHGDVSAFADEWPASTVVGILGYDPLEGLRK